MAFYWWTDTTVTYRHMESIQKECKNCNTVQKHTYRLYERKARINYFWPAGYEQRVTLICHGCLFESRVEKKQENELLWKYKDLVVFQDGQNFEELGKYNDAMKKFDKLLEEDPTNATAIYEKAKCLIAMGKYAESIPYVIKLMQRYPNNKDFLDMKNVLERNHPLSKITFSLFNIENSKDDSNQDQR